MTHIDMAADLRNRADSLRDVHPEADLAYIALSLRVAGYEIAAALWGIAATLQTKEEA
jgi:hypothetical protein